MTEKDPGRPGEFEAAMSRALGLLAEYDEVPYYVAVRSIALDMGIGRGQVRKYLTRARALGLVERPPPGGTAGSRYDFDQQMEEALELLPRYAGMSRNKAGAEIARVLGRSERQVIRYWQRARELGLLAPMKPVTL